MEVNEVSQVSSRFNLDRVAHEQMNEDLETWTPLEPTPSLRDGSDHCWSVWHYLA